MNTLRAIKKLKVRYSEYHKINKPLLPANARVCPNYFAKHKTTNGLTKCVIAYIKLAGWQAERINTQGRVLIHRQLMASGYVKKDIEWVPGTGQKGTADISATIEGKSVKIEVKNILTKDTMKKKQTAYRSYIEATGGIYYIARNFADFATWFDENFVENVNKNELFKRIIV